MQPPEVQNPIYERVLSHCKPSRFAGPLDFLTPDEAVHDVPCDPAALLDALSQEFSAEVLIEAGIARRAEDDSLVPVAALTDPDGMPLALRHPETGHAFELLTEAGGLSGSQLPIFAAMADGFTRDAAGQGDGNLFIAFSLRDVAVLRACGIPATLGTGLDSLSPPQVDRLCEAFGWKRSKSERHQEEEEWPRARPDEAHAPIRILPWNGSGTAAPEADDSEGATHEDSEDEIGWRLVFVGWTPSRLDRDLPEGLRDVVRHFEALHEHLGLDLFEITFWQPAAKVIDRLQYFVQHRDARWTREALLDSIFDSAGGLLMHFGKQLPRPLARPEDFPAALVRLHESIHGPERERQGPDAHQRTWRDLERLLDAQVIRPQMDDALGASNPVERSLRLTLAQVSRMFHTQAALANQKFSKAMARRGADRVDGLPLEQLDKLLAMADRLIGLSREIDRCQQSPTINVIPSSVVRTGQRRSLPNSD